MILIYIIPFFFKDIKLKELLESYQGIIVGQSAGSINLASNVYNSPEDGNETDINKISEIKKLKSNNIMIFNNKKYENDGTQSLWNIKNNNGSENSSVLWIIKNSRKYSKANNFFKFYNPNKNLCYKNLENN